MFFLSLRRGLRTAPRVFGGIANSYEMFGLDRCLAGLLLTGDGALRALAGASVGLGALTADRQALAVADALVGSDLDLAADVGCDFTAEVALDLEVALDVVTQLDQLVVTEVLDTSFRGDPGLGNGLFCTGLAHAVDVGKRDDNALFARDVYACETSHIGVFLT